MDITPTVEPHANPSDPAYAAAAWSRACMALDAAGEAAWDRGDRDAASRLWSASERAGDVASRWEMRHDASAEEIARAVSSARAAGERR